MENPCFPVIEDLLIEDGEKEKRKEKSIEEYLWDSANKLRGSVESAEYKHVVPGRIFLKYAGDKFEERGQQLINEGQEKYIERKEFYTMQNVFFLQETPDGHISSPRLSRMISR